MFLHLVKISKSVHGQEPRTKLTAVNIILSLNIGGSQTPPENNQLSTINRKRISNVIYKFPVVFESSLTVTTFTFCTPNRGQPYPR